MYQDEVEEKAKENLTKVRISGCGGDAGWRRYTWGLRVRGPGMFICACAQEFYIRCSVCLYAEHG